MATRYIRTDNRRLTYRECWNLAPGSGKIILIGAKLFGIPMKLAAGAPLTDVVMETLITPEEMIPEARERVANGIARLQALGFLEPQYISTKNSLLRGVYVVILAMRHRSEEVIGRVAFIRTTLV